MLDSTWVANLERGELESALVPLLRMNVYLCGRWMAGGGHVIHVGSFRGEDIEDRTTGEYICGTTWMPRVLDVAVEPDGHGFRLSRPAGDPEGLVRQMYMDLVLRHEVEVILHGRRALVGIPEMTAPCARWPTSSCACGSMAGTSPPHRGQVPSGGGGARSGGTSSS